MTNSIPQKSKFAVITGAVLFVELLCLYLLMKTPITEFSQNILKTFIFGFLTITPVYAYLVLLRFIRKKERALTAKQLSIFVLFFLGFMLFAFVADSFLVKMGWDIDKIPSNIFCFAAMAVYLILQHVFLVRKFRKKELVSQS